MKSTQRMLAVLAALVLGYVGAASAIPTIPSQSNLADLSAPGASIGIGDKVFSGFSYVDSGLTSFDASKIIVTASESGGIYYLTWDGNMSFVSGTTATTDLVLKYTVTATAGLITAIDQNYDGDSSGGKLAVDEIARVGSSIVGHSHLDPTHLSSPPAFDSNDILDIVPGQTTLDVTKDLFFVITGEGGGSVSISEVAQSFHQGVPDGGTTLVLLGAAFSGIALLRKKILV